MVGMVERRDLSQEFPMGTFKYPSDFLVCDCIIYPPLQKKYPFPTGWSRKMLLAEHWPLTPYILPDNLFASTGAS